MPDIDTLVTLATTVIALILADREFKSAAVVCIRDAQVPLPAVED